MNIQDISGKTICILGFGKEGKAMMQAIETFAPTAEITIADKNASVADDSIKHWWQVGEGWLKNLEKFDVIIKSPGIPPLPELESARSKIMTPTQIFLDSIPKEALVVGITGTKGKSTTASLIHAILKAAGKDVLLLGNIGEPSVAHLAQVTKDTIVIMEMSSYQLMDVTVSPQIAVITSFFPEHLDYHGSLSAYLEAKQHIVRFQKPNDLVFYAQGNGAEEIAKHSPGKQILVPTQQSPVSIEQTQLIGGHNLSNIALAWKVAEHIGIDRGTALKSIEEFHPLPHRLQSLGIIDGIEWIDDAISTTPESAIAAIDALGERVKTIFLGGQDRGVDFMNLAHRIAQSHIQLILLFPGSGPRIEEALQDAEVIAQRFIVDSMEEAIKIAKQHTRAENPASIALLSPASPSYGMYKNFEEKGDVFAKCIHQ